MFARRTAAPLDDRIVAEGRDVHVPGCGPVYVRIAEGPPKAPTAVLLHGLGATAALNWDPIIPALARTHRIVAPDLRGHGRGPRCGGRFQLEDCADDVAALIEATTVGPVLVVGYSMGGAVAQILCRRRPDLVSGLVLCATARDFRGNPAERVQFAMLDGLATASHLTPDWWPSLLPAVLRGWSRVPATVSELGGHQSRAVLAAAASLGRFTSRAWLDELRVPAVVVATVNDGLVPLRRQRKLAASLAAPVVEVDGNHFIAHRNPGALATGILDAIALLPRRPRKPNRRARRATAA